MKRILSTAALLMLATAATAGTSDRYNDLRFDSAVGHASDTAARTVAPDQTAKVILSTRNGADQRPPYPYANPLGVGPHNDSR